MGENKTVSKYDAKMHRAGGCDKSIFSHGHWVEYIHQGTPCGWGYIFGSKDVGPAKAYNLALDRTYASECNFSTCDGCYPSNGRNK